MASSDGGAAITVSMIHIPTWENELRVVEITAPIPVEEWLAQSTGGVLRARDPAVRLADRRRPVRWGARGGRPRRRRGQHVYVRGTAGGDPADRGAATGRPVPEAAGAHAGARGAGAAIRTDPRAARRRALSRIATAPRPLSDSRRCGSRAPLVPARGLPFAREDPLQVLARELLLRHEAAPHPVEPIDQPLVAAEGRAQPEYLGGWRLERSCLAGALVVRHCRLVPLAPDRRDLAIGSVPR